MNCRVMRTRWKMKKKLTIFPFRLRKRLPAFGAGQSGHYCVRYFRNAAIPIVLVKHRRPIGQEFQMAIRQILFMQDMSFKKTPNTEWRCTRASGTVAQFMENRLRKDVAGEFVIFDN